MNRLLNYLKKNQRLLLPLLIILILSAFIRFYRISDYLHFLGDEGRDVLVVKRILIDHEFTLLGPITSVGSMYLGPIYYYMMAPFLFLFNMDPVGPAVMVILLCLATIILIYKIGTEFFDLKTAIISSLLYSFSPLVIVYSRFSWNPNAVPFFATLFIYSLLEVLIKKRMKWIYVSGLSLGVLFQLHYLALMFIPLIILLLIVNKQFNLKNILKVTIGTIITYSPFIFFELRHHFPNTQTALRFIARTGGAATFSLNKFFFIVVDLTTRAFWRIVVIESNLVSKILMIFLFITFILIFRQKKPAFNNRALVILLSWFAVSLFFFGLYTGAIYDYYMVVFFPLPALLTGIAFSWYLSKKKVFRIMTLVFLSLLLFYQLKNSPLLKEPNRLLILTKDRAKFIYERVGQRPYNFALISGSNSDHAYRYFFELWGITPVTIKNPVEDPERKTVTDQLFVICEITDCKPLGNPLWEVAGFGRAEIVNSWQIQGVTIYKLVHYQG